MVHIIVDTRLWLADVCRRTWLKYYVQDCLDPVMWPFGNSPCAKLLVPADFHIVFAVPNQTFDEVCGPVVQTLHHISKAPNVRSVRLRWADAPLVHGARSVDKGGTVLGDTSVERSLAVSVITPAYLERLQALALPFGLPEPSSASLTLVLAALQHMDASALEDATRIRHLWSGPDGKRQQRDYVPVPGTAEGMMRFGVKS